MCLYKTARPTSFVRWGFNLNASPNLITHSPAIKKCPGELSLYEVYATSKLQIHIFMIKCNYIVCYISPSEHLRKFTVPLDIGNQLQYLKSCLILDNKTTKMQRPSQKTQTKNKWTYYSIIIYCHLVSFFFTRIVSYTGISGRKSQITLPSKLTLPSKIILRHVVFHRP